jgi:hypothetical protein
MLIAGSFSATFVRLPASETLQETRRSACELDCRKADVRMLLRPGSPCALYRRRDCPRLRADTTLAAQGIYGVSANTVPQPHFVEPPLWVVPYSVRPTLIRLAEG